MNRGPSRRRLLLVLCAVIAVLSAAALAVGLWRGAGESRAVPPAPSVTAPAGPGTGAPTASPSQGHRHDAGHSPTAAALPRSAPTKVTVPAIGVSSALEDLGLDGDGEMRTPRDPDLAGWYTPGPAPGQRGPAVIAGHVTWNGDHSVFYRLGELAPGDTVSVDREDGRTATFTVDRVEQYPKDEFPTVEVYRDLDHAGLRLITCAGDYSTAEHRYADNIVVYATLTDTDTDTE
ncbi:class F sortase [Streptomyces sp. AC512_CC834]|uniref:class F sortase n=1 Tax=Streptomyces sp. AC512_CC834 TaxID=2823691 RepID=UPI001C25C7A8|nr:class F sortase [Streptomyces sp. AC512_CC834]